VAVLLAVGGALVAARQGESTPPDSAR